MIELAAARVAAWTFWARRGRLSRLAVDFEQAADLNRDRLHCPDYGPGPVIRRNHFCGSLTAAWNSVDGPR